MVLVGGKDGKDRWGQAWSDDAVHVCIICARLEARTVELAPVVELEALGQPDGDVVLRVQRLFRCVVCDVVGVGGQCMQCS